MFPSICDPFEDRDDLKQVRHRFMGLIAATPRLDWLVLTKRPEVAAEYFRRRKGGQHWAAAEAYRNIVYGEDSDVDLGDGLADWPPRNLWLGVSAENQEYADERIPILLQIPAAVRFVSYEPALGPVDFRPFLASELLDWVIVGGESGSKARPFDVSWARDTIRQCREAGVAVFCKQLGAEPFDVIRANQQHLLDREHLGITDPKGGNIDEWEEDLRVREFPK